MSDPNKKFIELKKILYSNSLIYPTSDYFTSSIFKKINFDTNLYLNKPIFINNNFNPKEISYLKTLTDIAKKGNLLSQNTSTLLLYKSELDKEVFKYLFKNYLLRVSYIKKLSNNFIQSFKTNKQIEFNNELFSLFNNQNIQIDTHFEDIIKTVNIDLSFLNDESFGFLDFLTDLIDLILPVLENEEGFSFEKMVRDHTKNDSGESSENKKTLSDFINHKKAFEIEKLLIKKFDTEKGNKIRAIIECFIRNDFIALAYGDQRKIYDACKNTFNRDIGTYPSIWGYEISKRDSYYIDTKNKLKIFLEKELDILIV